LWRVHLRHFGDEQALLQLDKREFGGAGGRLDILNARLPFTDAKPAMKWDGGMA